jgi:hypothetical protein
MVQVLTCLGLGLGIFMSRLRPFLSLRCREGNKKRVRDREIDMRVRYERFRVWRVYFMVYVKL